MNSREATGLIELAKRLTNREDYNAAEVAYRQVLNRREFTTADKQEALIGIARMYRRQNSFAKAAAIYEKFLKEFPDDIRRPTLLLELGRTLRAMGAYSMAIARFYEVINSTLKLPADGFEEYQLLARTAQFEIAETHLESGNYAEAAKFFGRLRLLDLAAVDRARAHFKAGYALQLAGDFEGSIRLLREFVRNWPTDENSAEARYLLASAFWKLNRREDALAVTLELFRTEQTAAGADTKRWAYWQRRTGNQLANEFFQAGEFRGALSIYRGLAAQSVDPTWRLPALYQSALCQERLQAPADAAESYKKVCDEVPKDNPSVELAELKRMAAWRLENLQWNVDTARQINSYFSSTANSTAAPATPAKDASANSSPPAPQPPPHDSPASAPTTPAGLR